ncbi:Hsp20/alpha crystallin family protein [Noviherbaspirillum saxi]|uniref:Hsp20/alpha crystallin family protein n=1 Tax=Noviherbaspirillum saxi TaxID=2320863 RepID=A0A3A3FP85_9BURK|nr:Hsp20/alpha crystallin family protein [Noviherbaspirillum saxi]RJF98027.1 Hsp20/alpha crystallin family protein [Noviherbaspirillum saxi]
MKLDELKQGLSSFWDSMAEGWQHMRQSASTALTRFKPGEATSLPVKSDVDDAFFIPSGTWSMLGGDMFEDERRVVVRLEIPGLDKNDFVIDVQDGTLVVSGEKRFERESTEGRYRVLQCAYGSFRRAFPLSVAVLPEQAQASYKNGVLRVELPKASMEAPRKTSIKVE